MQIVQFGDTLKIFGDDLKTHGGKIPVGTWRVAFSPTSGHSLVSVNDLSVKDNKIYGEHEKKVSKIVRKFTSSNRSLGVILSGRKGIGKTMSISMLSQELAKLSIPTILVQDNFPGLPDFIESIEQEVLVVFDEFEKKFPVDRDDSYEKDACNQTDFLSLFDGISSTKRLYAVTVNETRELSNFMLGRPGRFHYHIKYTDLSIESILEYLKDNLSVELSEGDLKKISQTAFIRNFNFDMLRALCEELNFGSGIEETFEDLNFSDSNRGEESEDADFSFYFSVSELEQGSENDQEFLKGLRNSGLDFSQEEEGIIKMSVNGGSINWATNSALADIWRGTGVFSSLDLNFSFDLQKADYTHSGLVFPADALTFNNAVCNYPDSDYQGVMTLPEKALVFLKVSPSKRFTGGTSNKAF